MRRLCASETLVKACGHYLMSDLLVRTRRVEYTHFLLRGANGHSVRYQRQREHIIGRLAGVSGSVHEGWLKNIGARRLGAAAV